MEKALMTAKLTITALFVALTLTSCFAACPTEPNAPASRESAQSDPVKAVLKNLKKAAASLKTYQAKIEYLVQEPEYETQKIRKGELFYAKDPNHSNLRVNFETLKIDDQPPQPELEHYIFDGVWLTQIKYELKQARRIQQAEPNKPADPFELLSSRFPVIGFTNIEDLRKDFDITLVDLPADQKDKLTLLRLKVKPASKYAEDYTEMHFWLNAKLNLPCKIRAVAATEDEFILPDIHEITFIDPLVNKPIPPKIFDFQIPKGFQTETEPLKDPDN